MTPEQDTAMRQLVMVFGLFCGYLAVIVWIVWPQPHCRCCPKRGQKKS